LVEISELFENYLQEQNICMNKILSNQNVLNDIVSILIRTRNSGNKIFTCGNGGSASTASHFVSDLLKTTITKNEKRFSAISLVDNFAINSAWANDVSFNDVFIEQLKNFLSKNDVVFAFSGSGNSSNVIRALEFAKKNGATTIGFTGMSGGMLSKICDYSYVVPSDDMLAIESFHLMLCHGIIFTLRELGEPLFKYE
jgi:D-sedoheptulose 7-phosphate isomerase